MAALAAVPFVIAITIVSARYVTAESDQTRRQAVSAARDISGVLDLVLQRGLTALRTLSLSNAAKQGNFEVMYLQAAQVAQFLPGAVIALRSASDGQQYLNTTFPWGTALPKTTDPVLLAADRQAVEQNQPVVSDLYRGAATGKNFIIIQMPMKIGNAMFLLSMGIPPEVLRDVVEQSSAANSFWVVSIVDKTQRIILRTREHDEFVGTKASKVFSDSITADSGTFYNVALDGTEVFDAYAKSSLSGWVTVGAIPTADFNSPIKQAALVAGCTFILGLLFAIFLASRYSKYITERVLRLRDEAARLGQRKPVGIFATGIEELTEVSAALGEASITLARDEKAKSTLIDELNHRVKNSLATVQSLAQQTFHKNPSPAEFKAAFTGRLVALSKSHNALSKTDWVDADFTNLCGAVCPNSNDQISMNGSLVPLTPRAALTMGMVLHELCTNATKYGALADLAGRVDLSWKLDDQDHFHFAWVEKTARPIAPPKSLNFGMKYIKNSIEQELGGTVTFDFPPGGVVVRGSFPNNKEVHEALPLSRSA
jgi:two-component sensor histidine kinase